VTVTKRIFTKLIPAGCFVSNSFTDFHEIREKLKSLILGFRQTDGRTWSYFYFYFFYFVKNVEK
jgi:hypothetical protein